MNITETTHITITHSVGYTSYGDETTFVRVGLSGGLTAYFFSDSDSTKIDIDGVSGTIYKFVVPTVRALSVVAYAITNPDSFVESCRAFLTQR